MDDSGINARLRIAGRPSRGAAELATHFAKRGSALLGATVGSLAARGRAEVFRWAARRRIHGQSGRVRLCLGSGHAPIPGWINVDFEPPADILLDLRFPLPWPNMSVAAIYSEHLVEHVPLEDARSMFREWRRVIASDGVVRVATPDLARLIEDYRGDWRARQTWVTWPEYAYIDTPVHMINVAARNWGHQYLYDFEELALRLREAGFGEVRRFGIGESEEPALRALETRADSTLIVEARP